MQKTNQALLAKLRQGGQAANQERSKSTLASYFHDVSYHELLGPEEELELGRIIEELELHTWELALSHAPAASYVAAFAEDSMGKVVPELEAVRYAAGNARGRAGKQRLRSAAQVAARALREADDDHRHLDHTVAELERLARGSALRVDVDAPGFSTRTKTFATYVRKVTGMSEQAAEHRHLFVRANLRLVVHIAAQYRHYGVPFSDLIQEGNIGLMKAVDRYDHRRGYRFSTYASWWVRHMIGRAVADTSRTVRVPVHVRDANQRIARVRRKLTAELGRAPTNQELAEAADMTPEKLESVRQAMSYSHVSLDEPIGEDHDQARQEIFTDPANEQRLPFDDFYDKSMAADLRRRMSALSAKEIDILNKRYALDCDREWTLQEIADQYGVSRERIRQIQAAALGKLRSSFEADEEQLEQQLG